MGNVDDYLLMSGIQHFSFCRRQWALIHLEQQWAENLRTAEGRLEHERCHDESFTEKRGNLLVVRGMRVVSHRLRMSGSCRPRRRAAAGLQRHLAALACGI